MDPWCRSDIIFQCMEGLVHHGLICAWTVAEELLLPSEEDVLSLLNGYVASFA